VDVLTKLGQDLKLLTSYSCLVGDSLRVITAFEENKGCCTTVCAMSTGDRVSLYFFIYILVARANLASNGRLMQSGDPSKLRYENFYA
jgi:hypothetical protein